MCRRLAGRRRHRRLLRSNRPTGIIFIPPKKHTGESRKNPNPSKRDSRLLGWDWDEVMAYGKVVSLYSRRLCMRYGCMNQEAKKLHAMLDPWVYYLSAHSFYWFDIIAAVKRDVPHLASQAHGYMEESFHHSPLSPHKRGSTLSYGWVG